MGRDGGQAHGLTRPYWGCWSVTPDANRSPSNFGAPRMKGPITIIAVCFAGLGSAQVNAPVNGPHDKARQVEAFVRATIHTTPGQVIRNATMLIQGDKILAVGDGVQVPEGSVVHDLAGRHLWPALIDPYSDLGMVSAEKEEPQERGAHYWNPAIRASRASKH